MTSGFHRRVGGDRLGILVGGGPAPGINGVIRAATIEAVNSGLTVIGIYDGFKWLVRGDNSKVINLGIRDVSRIHFRGGSILRTARANPTRSPELMSNAVRALQNLELDYLVTIGGDDTAFSAMKIAEAMGGALKIAHVPKTIDNDLPMPGGLSTFGYQTARHVGVQLVQHIMVDAQTTSRWYLVVSMGRKAGHLALGIAKAASATLAVIAEEFRGKQVPLSTVCDIIEGAILKRASMGKDYGVAILSEGLIEAIAPEDLLDLDEVERDEHGHIRYSEISLGHIVKSEIKRRLRARGINMVVVDKDLGYELRCAAPIPFDCEYTQDLGCSAVDYLLGSESGAMICRREGRLHPVPLGELRDPETGRTRVRLVDTGSDSYKTARKYMIRLGPGDFEDAKTLARLARTAGTTPEGFSEQFKYLVDEDPQNGAAAG